MANNLIQIKRSLTTAVPGSLANGEMAFTSNGDVLFIGANGAIEPIAGKRFPGTLTANQALVANATSGIDKIIVANAAISQLNANGSTGTAGQVLKSAGAGANSFWADETASVAGLDTQVQYNDNGSLAGAVGFTYNKATNAVSMANTLTVTSSVTTNSSFVVGAGLGQSTAGSTSNTTVIGISSNSTVNATHTAALLQVANSTASANHTAIGFAAGITVQNTTAIAVGTNNFINATAIDIGNSIMTSVLLTLGGQVNANGGVGTLGQMLTSGAAGNVYWTTPAVGTITGVTAGSGLTGGGSSGSVTLDVGQGNGITVGADAISVAANTTGGLLANTTLQVKVGTGLVFDGSGNVAVNSAALSFQDLTVSGNLTVLGDLVSMNVATLAIEDPLIVLAKDQSNTTTFTDAVDIGFYGSYGNTLTKNWAGLFRDQSDSGIFKLFAGNIPEPTTTVNTSNVNFAYSTLQSYIRTGGAGATGLIANATHIAITANSTLNVAIVANTLTLSTPLAGTSGGTGKATMTSQAILVGNTTNGYAELTLGADGRVLQSNGTALVYDTLDGGTF